MPLTLDWSKVDDWETLHEDEKQYVITETLGHMLMGLDMNRITESNVAEVAARAHMLQELMGEFMYADGKRYFITMEDVFRRVGLGSNVSEKSRSSWLARMFKGYLQDAELAYSDWKAELESSNV